ncbi:MAG: type II secretion system F family protein [Propionibacteriaceae bacterium]|jgi:Flp pilus assembly protein TadB|nr:type II secretion system F family protein [Propionibacteriaceae bacterium]
MVVIVAVLGAVIAGGVLLIIRGARPHRRQVFRLRLPRLRWNSPVTIGSALFVVGLVIAIWTGWTVAVVIAPMIGLGLPYLLGSPQSSTDIAKLEAMEEWTRSLCGILTAGAGLEQALVATLPSTPAPIRPAVTRLITRLRARWTTPAALRGFADDLNDPTGDIIAANLLLGAQRRGDGLTTVLEGLAETVALDIRARRQVQADAAKPRATARWVTVITLTVLAGLFLTGSYVAPYRSGFGQIILLVLLGAYAAVLVWMRRIAAGEPAARLLGPSTEAGLS